MSRDIPLHTGSTPAHAPRMAVADSATRGGATMGLLGGQDVLTVDTMQAKIRVQLRGLGGGFLPEPMVRPYLEAGRLVARRVSRPERHVRVHYCTMPGAARASPHRGARCNGG